MTTPQTLPAMTDFHLAKWCTNIQRSVLRQLIAVISQPGVVSFAGGLPAPELFPVKGYAEALQIALSTDPLALQYRPPYEPLKKHVVKLMAQRGVSCVEDNIFFTTGAQQGLDVLARMFLDYGDEIILEEIVYTGMQQVLAPMHPKIHTVKTDPETGIDVDAVEKLLKDGVRPKFLYVIPNAQNPQGISISLEKREKLAKLVGEYHVPLFEDDPYGLLKYDDSDNPCIKSFEPNWVFYLGSFSKVLAPALRLGWIVCPSQLMSTLNVVKEACDLECSALTQRAISTYLDQGVFEEHLKTLVTEYRKRRDAMLTALSAHFPTDARWTVPSAGMFIWATLPESVNTADLLRYSLETEKIAFVPGYAFALPGTNCSNCLRLNFSSSSVEVIEDGIARLGAVIKRFIAEKGL